MSDFSFSLKHTVGFVSRGRRREDQIRTLTGAMLMLCLIQKSLEMMGTFSFWLRKRDLC